MDELTMFDPEPFGHSRKAEKSAPPPTTPIDTVAVSGVRWNGTSKTTPGVAHYVDGLKSPSGAIVSMCGLVVVPHTYETDEQRPGCATCAVRVKRG